MQKTRETFTEKVEHLQLQVHRWQHDPHHDSTNYKACQRSIAADNDQCHPHLTKNQSQLSFSDNRNPSSGGGALSSGYHWGQHKPLGQPSRFKWETTYIDLILLSGRWTLPSHMLIHFLEMMTVWMLYLVLSIFSTSTCQMDPGII